MRPSPTRCLVVLALLAVVRPAAAQSLIARADSLVRGGSVPAAESLYYTAVRREPRDPATRLALGRYLAARGALRVGAVLMEEARFFGGDAKTVARELAPVYARLGDYRALASLPGTPLPAAERARAEWLRSNGPLVVGPDSVRLPYLPQAEGALALVTLIVGTDSVVAAVDPAVQGLVLDPAWMTRRESRIFPAGARDPRGVAGVTNVVRLGALSLGNVPTRYAPQGGTARARIGLDLLASLAPTFDGATRRVTLRRTGRVATSGGERLPALVTPAGVLVARDGLWPLGGERGRLALSGAHWTLDARRGEIVVGR